MANGGMQTIRSDEQVKPTRPTTLEANVHSAAVVVSREDCVIEDRLDPRFDLLVNRSCQLPPRNAQEAAPSARRMAEARSSERVAPSASAKRTLSMA